MAEKIDTQKPDSEAVAPASDLFGFAHGGVWCCEHKAKCKWQGFALHQGLAWGEVPKLFPGYRDWRAVHDQECGGRLIQLVEPNSADQATASEPPPQTLQTAFEPLPASDLFAVLSPVINWYQSDEEDARPPLDTIRDIVADLQTDRAAWIIRMVSPRSSPSREAVQYADYILNHYARNSHADKLCLARDLERHGWRNKRANDGGLATQPAPQETR